MGQRRLGTQDPVYSDTLVIRVQTCATSYPGGCMRRAVVLWKLPGQALLASILLHRGPRETWIWSRWTWPL